MRCSAVRIGRMKHHRSPLMPPSSRSPTCSLPFGSFFGRASVERSVGQVKLAEHEADPSRIIERHVHEDAHFVLVLAGDYVTSAQGGATRDGGPLLVYNPPGTVHADRFGNHDGVFVGRFFTLSVPASMEVNDAGRPLSASEARTLTHPFPAALAHQLVRECRRWDSSAPSLVESLSLELVAIADEGTLGTVRAGDASPGHTPPGWLYRAVEQIEDRCTSDVSIRDLARDAGVHPVHVARAFRRWMGCAPGELLRRRRVERALIALRSTATPISRVAAECGFGDQSHLHRAVRRSTGMTPLVYRRQASATG